MTKTSTTNQPDLIAFTVQESGEKSFFSRIGAAWANSKGGYKIRLSAFPVNGEILLMPPREGDEG